MSSCCLGAKGRRPAVDTVGDSCPSTHWGDVCDLLVVLRSKVVTILYLAHAHPLGGHLGPQNTLEKTIPLTLDGGRGVPVLPTVSTVTTHLPLHTSHDAPHALLDPRVSSAKQRAGRALQSNPEAPAMLRSRHRGSQLGPAPPLRAVRCPQGSPSVRGVHAL